MKVNNKYLFLDDWRNPSTCVEYMHFRTPDYHIYTQDNWDVVRSYGDFIAYIEENGLPKLISFDHDLADVEELKEDLPIEKWFDLDKNREYTGVDCCRWLCEYCLERNLDLCNYLIHSANPDGCKNMYSVLKTYTKMREKI